MTVPAATEQLIAAAAIALTQQLAITKRLGWAIRPTVLHNFEVSGSQQGWLRSTSLPNSILRRMTHDDNDAKDINFLRMATAWRFLQAELFDSLLATHAYHINQYPPDAQ